MSLVARVKYMLPNQLKAILKSVTGRDVFKSYSQFGEDAYLYAYFIGKTWREGVSMYLPSDGFYVDVGAYSPTECSNTHAFYKHGWNGINIDATPGVMSSFDLLRKRDINLNVAIGSESKTLIFYSWGAPNVFNTADPELAQQRAKILGQKPHEINVQCLPLAEVLEKHMPSSANFNFLTVDVEGLDLEVLQSNNWQKYRPELVVAENYSSTLDDLKNAELLKYMTDQGYEILAWLKPSIIFQDKH